MKHAEVERVLQLGSELGEGPIWDHRENALWFLNINGREVHRLDPATHQHSVFLLVERITALGLRARGGFIAVTETGFGTWQPGNPTAAPLGSLPRALAAGQRFNDGAVDRRGRFWAGTCGSKRPENKLYCLDREGLVSIADSGFILSNGLDWSPDDRTLYFTDSLQRCIYAYDFEPASGVIRGRRVFAEIPANEGVPDGLAVDAEGCVWSARWSGWKVVRYDPHGQVISELHMPVSRPSSCTFGGADLDELYITSAWEEMTAAERAADSMAGDLFRCCPGVKGLPAPMYLG